MRKYLMLVILPLLLLVSACAPGGEGQTQVDGQTPTTRLQEAKQALDKAENIGVELSTENLPASVDGLVSATGTGTHEPTFKGEVKVSAGTEISAPIIALDGKVYAQLPFVGWKDIDPTDYGAPDPAQLMSTTDGVSSLFTATDATDFGDETRDGEDVLTEVMGTIPGSAMQRVFPSSGDGQFKITYELTAENEPRRLTITGPFYPDAPDVTYVMALDLDAQAVSVEAPI